MDHIKRRLDLIQIDDASTMARSLNGLLTDFAERYRFGLTSEDSIRNFDHFLELNRRSLIYLFGDLDLADLRDTHLMKLIKWWERQPMDGLEREIITETLGRLNYNLSQTARELGLTRRGLSLKMGRLRIDPKALKKAKVQGAELA